MEITIKLTTEDYSVDTIMKAVKSISLHRINPSVTTVPEIYNTDPGPELPPAATPGLPPATPGLPPVTPGPELPPAATPGLPPIATNSQAGMPTAPGVEVDPRGIPWDERIHSKNRTRIVKDNTWKQKRKLKKEYVAAVEAELLGGIPASAIVPQAPTAAPAVVDLVGLVGLMNEKGIVMAQADAALIAAGLPIFNQLMDPANTHLIPQAAVALGG